jgi:dihydrofolate reductase
MTKVKIDITMSLDGFVAGPNPTVEHPLGENGERLHEWIYGLASWNESHGRSGGSTGPDDALVNEDLRSTGAYIMGRGMFGGGEGPWGDEPWQGWWGDDPPFHAPVFVLTHHAREPLTLSDTTFTFVTDGIESALEQARAAAGERDVKLAGGASIDQQYLKAGLVDELQIHVAPLILGGGTRLFGELDDGALALQQAQVIESPAVTHLRYRVAG